MYISHSHSLFSLEVRFPSLTHILSHSLLCWLKRHFHILTQQILGGELKTVLRVCHSL